MNGWLVGWLVGWLGGWVVGRSVCVCVVVLLLLACSVVCLFVFVCLLSVLLSVVCVRVATPPSVRVDTVFRTTRRHNTLDDDTSHGVHVFFPWCMHPAKRKHTAPCPCAV